MVRWQKQGFIHTRLSRAYLALARLYCSLNQTLSTIVFTCLVTHASQIWRWKSGNFTALRMYCKTLCCRWCVCGRIFNHPNVLPVLGACNQPPNLVVISQLMPFSSLYNVLHGETGQSTFSPAACVVTERRSFSFYLSIICNLASIDDTRLLWHIEAEDISSFYYCSQLVGPCWANKLRGPTCCVLFVCLSRNIHLPSQLET